MALTGSNQWPVVDELKGFSGHGGSNLEKEKEITREVMNEKNDRRNEGKDNGCIRVKLAKGHHNQKVKTPNKMYDLS